MNLIKTPDQSVNLPMALWRCILYDPLPPFGSAEAYESSTLNQKCFATRTYHATTYINKQKSTTPRYRAPLTPISKTVVEIICWVHLFRSAVEIICLDQLLRCDLLRLSIETCYWGQSLTSTVDIIRWVHLLRSAVEIICLDQLLRFDFLWLSVGICCWNHLLKSTIEITCWVHLLTQLGAGVGVGMLRGAGGSLTWK